MPPATDEPTAVRDRRRQSGVVLALVLVIALLLSTAVIAFARRSTIDRHIASNRDAAARADALARGGIQIGLFLLLDDGVANADAAPGDTHLDAWARAEEYGLETPDGDRVRIRVSDEGARLNLNAIVPVGDPTTPDSEAVEYLVTVLEKVIADLPVPPGERVWDPRELAYNFVDYVDEDEERLRGGDENDGYLRQDPPYEAANEPLRSVDELRRIEGFDAVLVDGLRPYVSVHPRAGGAGIDLNTAPPHVLALVWHGSQGSRRLASEDTVRRILRARAEGRILCQDAAADDRCILASEIVEGSVFPPASLPLRSRIFAVEAEASVGEIRRSIEAVVDRSGPAPLILSWRRP